MKLDSEILAQKNSPYLGKEIFVCNYLHFDFDLCSNGAYRHTVPTKCILVPKSESPSVKQLYGSENALVKLTKKGVRCKSIVQIYEYNEQLYAWGRSGNSFKPTPFVACFDNADECLEHYRMQCRAVISTIEDNKKRLDDKIAELIVTINTVKI